MSSTAARFVLEDRILEGSGGSYWRGHDALLQRSVGILVLDGDHPRAEPVLRAARAAATVTDPRFLRVLDADLVDGRVHVVSEWVRAVDLADLLTHGPLDPEDAALLIHETASALASAHASGLAHRCLDPRSVLRTDAGSVKVVGLGIDAALRGLDPVDDETSAQEDARLLGALLFAGLTARWPADDSTSSGGLAVVAGGAQSPRQVRAGVPAALDLVTARALGSNSYGGHAPLESPAEVEQALDSALRGPMHRGAPAREPNPTVRRAVLAVLAGLGLVLAAVIGFALLSPDDEDTSARGTPGPTTGFAGPGAPTQPGASSSAPPPTNQGEVLRVASVRDFDPDGDGEESADDVDSAIDGQAGTSWLTTTYKNRADLGGLKDGVGLLLDLGAIRQVGAVAVALVGTPTSLELRTATSPVEQSSSYRTVAIAENAGASVTLVPEGGRVDARYVLVWLTSLPRDGSDFRGGISEVSVRAP